MGSSSLTRDHIPQSPALGGRHLSHWTTRVFPATCFLTAASKGGKHPSGSRAKSRGWGLACWISDFFSSPFIYITICKIDSQQKFAVWLRKLKQGLCINLEGWDGREIGRRFKREGIYVYLWLIHVEV